MNIEYSTDRDFANTFNKLYQEYGEEFAKLLGVDMERFDRNKYFNKYTKGTKQSKEDLIVNPSANVTGQDIKVLTRDINDAHDKLFAMNKIYLEMKKQFGKREADKWLEMIWIGELYMHDFPSSTFKPYCFATSLQSVAEKGLFFIDQFPAGPAKHLDTFCHHVLETVSWCSNKQSGAVGLPDLLVYMYYFWSRDVKSNYMHMNEHPDSADRWARQNIQSVIFDMNQPYLRITESAFTNVTIMDKAYLEGFFGAKEFPDGEPMVLEIDEIQNFQKIFMEELCATLHTQMFTFPVITYSALRVDGKFADEEFARWACETNMEWNNGNFYISGDVTSLSSCCRLVNDTAQINKKLEGHVNSIGGTDLDIGSCKVSTINLHRIALKVKYDNKDFFEELEKDALVDIKSLHIQRHIIQRNIEKGLLPNFTSGLVKFERMFSTIGIVGLYEALDELNLINTDEFGNKSYSEEGLNFAVKVLDTLNNIKDRWTEDKEYTMNIEAIPAESAAVKLAKADALMYPDSKKIKLLGNQWIPLSEACTLEEKLRLGKILDSKVGGGQIAHINIAGRFNNFDQAWDMLDYCAENGGAYFCFNSITNECANSHHWIGSKICPICGGEIVDQYTKLVGFTRPVSSFGKERAAEFKARKWMKI